jgi:hypothetical protein
VNHFRLRSDRSCEPPECPLDRALERQSLLLHGRVRQLSVAVSTVAAYGEAACKVVNWDGVTHVRKSAKLGLYDGVAAELQILRLQSPWDVILQNHFLLILSLSPTDPRRQIHDRFASSISDAWIGHSWRRL